MTEQPETSHRRPHAQPGGAVYVELDLARELEELRHEPEWKSGHNAKTLVKTGTLRIVLTSLAAQARIPSHRTDGGISIHTLSGHIVEPRCWRCRRRMIAARLRVRRPIGQFRLAAERSAGIAGEESFVDQLLQQARRSQRVDAEDARCLVQRQLQAGHFEKFRANTSPKPIRPGHRRGFLPRCDALCYRRHDRLLRHASFS